MTSLVLILFVGFFVGTLVEILAMLKRKREGRALERFQLVFFFVACLMLVCLVPLWMAELLTREVALANIAAVAANLAGWMLTFSRGKREGQGREKEAVRVGIRTYMLYHQGKQFGLIAKGTYDKLAELGLLKKQRTVELVDDYQEQARKLGVKIQLFKNKDGTQTLVKVETPEQRGTE